MPTVEVEEASEDMMDAVVDVADDAGRVCDVAESCRVGVTVVVSDTVTGY